MLRRIRYVLGCFWAVGALLACAIPALGEGAPTTAPVGQTGDLYIQRLTAPNGQLLYFASIEPESPVLERDLNGDGLADLAVATRMGASNIGHEFFLRSGDAYVPVKRLWSGEEAFFNFTCSPDGRYVATNADNGYAQFDNYLYAWSGTDLLALRRAVSQPKTEIQVTDGKLITTEYQDVLEIRVWAYNESGEGMENQLLYQTEVNLSDEEAYSVALDMVQSLMAFPQ